MSMSDQQVPLHLVGTQDFFPALLSYVQSLSNSASLPLDHVIFQSILLCLIAGDKNLILRAPEEDIGLTAKLVVWTLSSVFNLTTHKVKIRSRTSSNRSNANSALSADPAAFLRSLFLPSGASSSNHGTQDENLGDNAKLFGHRHQPSQASSRSAKSKLKQSQPDTVRSRSFPNNLATAAQTQDEVPLTTPDVLITQFANPESSPTTNFSPLPILKPRPLHPHALPHAFTDPLPLPPRRRRKPSQPKQLTQLPQALVLTGLEHASSSVQRTLITVLSEREVVFERREGSENVSGTVGEDGTWNLPDGFIAVYICAWNARERPAIHRTLLNKFAMSSNVFISQKVRHDWNMLLFPPSPRSLQTTYISHSNPGSPSPVHPAALPPSHTPPTFTKQLPLHQRHSSHSAHFYPPPLPDQVLPLSFIKTLQEIRTRTHMSHRLELYLCDLFTATRHHHRLDAMMLTATSKQDAHDLVRASRVIGRDPTGMELLRPPIIPDVDERLSSHESDEVISRDYVRLSRFQSTTSTSESLPSASREGLESGENVDKVIETRRLDVSEVDVARIVPRVVSHRIRMRDGPKDEILASVLFGATFEPKLPDVVSKAEHATANKLQSVKSVLRLMTMPDSTADDLTASRSQSKKRRIPGACDICKRKKIRCDSGEMPDNRCSNCLQYGYECTHKEVTKTLGPAKGYVESLEARLEKMDRLLSKLLPGIDVNQEVERLESRDPSEPEILARNDDECSPPLLTVQLNKLSINPPQNRFFGKSSGYQLIQTALDMKQVYTGEQTKNNESSKPPFKPLFQFKRSEFWQAPPWMGSNPENEPDPPPNYTYPEEDLIPLLIDAYFKNLNVFLPLLHRPTFEKAIAEGLHHSNAMFGAVLLMVCAHGSRFSDDPRTLAEGSDSLRSAGWKWFQQVSTMRKSLIKRTTLYELQLFALHVMFAQTSETPHGVWAEIGLALRLAQDVGGHRRRRKGDVLPTAEDELWKRAFWIILSLDRTISSFSGRPCGLQDEDFDLDLPLEVDDEYWEHGFQQPTDKPCSIEFFNTYLRLMDIHAYAMRSIYSIKRSGSGNIFNQSAQRSDQELIAELDSAMNNWMDSVPSHLRWPPNGSDELILRQSAALHATYYHLQIFIHRPFIPSPRNPVPGAFPSLAICTNAARSCCHVLESFTRVSPLPLSQLQNTVFISALILLLNIWSGKRSGYAPNPRREMEDVRRCMDVLKAAEKRWASAGRYYDILTELAYAGDLSIPPTYQPTNNSHKKRNRAEEEDSSPTSSNPVSPTIPDAPRSMAGSKRVSQSNMSPHSGKMLSQAPPLLTLPMYGNELGRLPIYGQFAFSDPYGSQIPVQQPPGGFDQTLMSIASNTQGLPPNIDGFTFGNMFNGDQAIDNLPGQAHFNTLVAPDSEFASFLSGTTFNGASGNGWSAFGSIPAMDSDTMTMWSTAPTNLELDDWNSYISSVEQMTQANQGQVSIQ